MQILDIYDQQMFATNQNFLDFLIYFCVLSQIKLTQDLKKKHTAQKARGITVKMSLC